MNDMVSVWRAGDDGFARYRIPAIVRMSGRLVAFAEARRSPKGGDWGDVEIVSRVSDDGGATWGPSLTVASGERPASPVAVEKGLAVGTTHHNPTPIVDGRRLHLLSSTNYQEAWHRTSDDGGWSWSAPRDITLAFSLMSDYPWRVIAIGPGHGLRMSGGALFAGAWMSLGTEGREAHAPSVSTCITSDDRGETWRRGPIVCAGDESPNEAIPCEIDGRPWLSVRTHKDRLIATRADDGSWVSGVDGGTVGLPACHGGMITVGERRAFSAIVTDSPRSDLRLHVWDARETSARVSPIHDGPARYSDLTDMGNGFVGCLYEYGSQTKGGIGFKRAPIV